MQYQATTALRKISSLKKRIRVIQGGTSASKTISALLYLIDKAQQREGIIISVVSHTLPHLRKGAMRDFLNIMKAHNYYDDKAFNKSNLTYTFESGSIIEFFSVDEDSARGPRRNVLFVNEANLISYETYTQLEIRTSEEIILDFNPVAAFWVHEQVMPKVDHDFLKLTYLDNEALPRSIIQSIESKRDNENWWKVYGLGEIGVKEGNVYSNWSPLELPEEAELKGYGMDFGYTNDPTAIVAVYKWNNSYILDEICYQTGMVNKDIYDRLLEYGATKELIVADSAEPKSIEEIKRYGVPNIIGATKGRDSVLNGIQLIQGLKVYYTPRSSNIEREYLNYMWKLDKTGKPLNIPESGFDHAHDAIRYIMTEIENPSRLDYDDLIYFSN